MIIDRAAREVHQHGDLAGGETARRELQHLCLAFGKLGLILKEMGSPPGMMMTVVPTWMALSLLDGALLSTASGRMMAFTAAVSEFDFDLDDRSDGE